MNIQQRIKANIQSKEQPRVINFYYSSVTYNKSSEGPVDL